MPFGFERKEIERGMDNPNSPENKLYVEAKAMNKKDGSIIPLSFMWEDEEIKVDKVISAKSGMSLKCPTQGIVYKCRTGNKAYILGFDGRKWYIDFLR